jgi:hypothetical protein
MIIQDEDDLLKSKDPLVTTPVLRYPERAAGRRRRPFSPLPDYETSQALALNDLNDSLVSFYKPPPKRRFIDSKSWRAGIAALGIYIILSIIIGIPLIIKVSIPIPCVACRLKLLRNLRQTNRPPTTTLTMSFLG